MVKPEHRQLYAFLGAYGVQTHKLANEAAAASIASILFGVPEGVPEMVGLTIDALGKKERKRRVAANIGRMPIELMTQKKPIDTLKRELDAMRPIAPSIDKLGEELVATFLAQVPNARPSDLLSFRCGVASTMEMLSRDDMLNEDGRAAFRRLVQQGDFGALIKGEN